MAEAVDGRNRLGEFVCPNGHRFPHVVAVPCDECDSRVVCEPVARGMATREKLDKWIADLDFYATTADGSPELVRAVAVEIRHHLRAR